MAANSTSPSFATAYPLEAATWHPTKNGELTSENVTPGSNKNIWWQCEKGHEWQSKVFQRAKGYGCPYCSNKKVLVGYNDLATTNPDVAAQWHPTKNGSQTPQQVVAGNKQKVWWLDEFGHEWEATVIHRGKNGTGCPICSGLQILKGLNDLATTNPELAAQWHPTKNGALKPEEIQAGNSKKVWWLCENGHEWETAPYVRRRGLGCPVCSNQLLVAGVNDLASTNPELAAQWHPTKNATLTPQKVVAGSSRKVWWQDEFGHEWEATCSNRNKGTGCPVCSNQLLVVGVNDLATTNPDVAAQWHPTKNGSQTPQEVVGGSNTKAWWLDEFGHEWEAVTAYRVKGTGCPVCSNQLLVVGVNDLATTNPDVAAQWHPTKNENISPQEVVEGGKRKVWWQCENGHEWEATLSDRHKGNGCPFCGNRRAFAGYNDLAFTNPELSEEWHPTKNGQLLPSQLTAGSGIKAWWLCSQGHEWQAGIAHRSSGSGCPTCANTGYNQAAPGLFYFIEHSEYRAKKIGITNADLKSDRIAAFGQNGWSVITVIQNPDGSVIRALETQMLRWLRKDKGLPPFLGNEEMKGTGGWSETFSADELSSGEVLEKIQEVLEKILET